MIRTISARLGSSSTRKYCDILEVDEKDRFRVAEAVVPVKDTSVPFSTEAVRLLCTPYSGMFLVSVPSSVVAEERDRLEECIWDNKLIDNARLEHARLENDELDPGTRNEIVRLFELNFGYRPRVVNCER
jgi:hypothetical protein